ncbi:MAG: hypothetical protein ABIK28_12500 [Planctomycetota bacterium]
MMQPMYLFTFNSNLSMDDVRETLLLSAVAAESYYGNSKVKMDFSYSVSNEKPTCLIDAESEVGQHVARVFTGFLANQYGEDSFRVERVERGLLS